ncbi:protein KRI1 homolog isoform X1 [Eucalyptus grandis]|uniref:protein KRI1 homolog isoform X1 n=2 Tax=Eucalyptus grandis TaxID=71139 RepID=UPI00192EF6F3|nr:protein KRI1 homolog isoform X1 [Eucalyptus grandis]
MTVASGMGMKLFDGGDSDDENVSKIEINKEYARRFEHNKKREDLHRLQELKKKGLVGDDSSSESGDESSSESSSSLDDDVDVSKASKKDLDFFNALLKVRSRDPSLKEKNVALFESEDSDGDEEKESKDRKHKLYLKDVVAKQLIEEGPDFDDEQTEVTKKKSYSEEQEEMRRAFLEAAEAAEAAEVDGDGGDFLTLKRRDDGEPVEGGDGAEFQQKLDEYFGRSEALGENEMFLKEFFLNKMWVDKDKKSKGHVNEEELEELLKDEEEIEKQEDYETNFRYEENAGDRVLGHSRTIEGSVRKKETARKKQRESKEERMKIAEMERKEELKHLKNLKKEEMKQKLEKFKQIAGIDEDGDCPLDGVDLDDDFDPEEYDRMMKQVFNQKYYNADDVDPDFGSDRDEDGGEIEKPDFEKEDELLGLPVGWDESESKDGFVAARERSLRHKLNDGGEDDSDDDEEEEEEEAEDSDHVPKAQNEETISSEDGKRKRKRKLSLLKRAKEAMMEEYYKLDYEDTIGDLKTRFKYAKIKPNRYGLNTSEILMMDDNELNQYVSLKKLAPYREKEWRVHNNQRHQLKLKTKELLEEGKRRSDKKKRRKDYSNASTAEKGSLEDGKSQKVELHEDSGKLSKNARRRRRQAEVKLSNSRLIAYGKITPNSKGKTKS